MRCAALVLALATLLATALSGACSAAVAAPKAVEAFDATTWPALQQARQPVAVVFTTTDCSHCPAVVEQLARAVQQRRDGARLVTVVMDVPPGEADINVCWPERDVAQIDVRPVLGPLAGQGA